MAQPIQHGTDEPLVMFPAEFERACAIVAVQLDTNIETARERVLAYAEATGETPDVTAWAVTSRSLRFRPQPC